jgi:hypothetical protein
MLFTPTAMKNLSVVSIDVGMMGLKDLSFLIKEDFKVAIHSGAGPCRISTCIPCILAL